MIELGGNTNATTPAQPTAAVQPTAAQAQATAQHQAAPQPASIPGANTMMNGLGIALPSMGAGSQVVETFIETVKQALADRKDMGIVLISGAGNMAMPAAVVYGKKGTTVYYCTLMLELAGQRPADDHQQVRNGPVIIIDQVATHCFDEFYQNAIETALRTKLDAKDFVATPQIVVLKEDDLADHHTVRQLARTAYLSVDRALAGTGAMPASTTRELCDNRRIVADAYTYKDPEPVRDSMGRPVAADIVGSVVAERTGTQRSLNVSTGQNTVLANFAAMINYEYADPGAQKVNAAIQNMNTIAAHSADLTITSVSAMAPDSDDTTESIVTPFIAALALLPVALPGGLVPVLSNFPAGKPSIETLGYEHNAAPDKSTGIQGKGPIPLCLAGTPVGDEESVADVVAAYINGVAISMDIEIGSREYWAYADLLSAANGNKDANARVLRALDVFACGRFAPALRASGITNTNVFVDSRATQFGTYPGNGGQRSMRELNYPTMLDLYKPTDRQTRESFNEWARTWEIDQPNNPINLDTRRQYLTETFGVNVTGMGANITFNLDILSVFAQAFSAPDVDAAGNVTSAGVEMRRTGILLQQTTSTRQGRNVQGGQLNANAVNGMFSVNTTPQGQDFYNPASGIVGVRSSY